MSYHQHRQIQNDETFTARYSPCSGYSIFHDLSCGHRIQSTSLSESCGTTCKKAATNAPFVCPDCVVADVRLEMLFEDISLSQDDKMMSSDALIREQHIQAITRDKIQKLLALRFRMCKVTQKFDDVRLQFFNQFMEEEGFGGVDCFVESVTDRKLKRPMPGDRVRKGDPSASRKPRDPQIHAKLDLAEDELAMAFTVDDIERDWNELVARFEIKTGLNAPPLDSLTEQMNHWHIEHQREDDAMMAVRQQLEACTFEVIGAAED